MNTAALRAKVIAMYFPQFHSIVENDAWWGNGFTDWDLVKAAHPLYAGHYQPRIPLGKNYYDQSKLETLRWQIGLAREHGIYGFAHYHYWFDGRQLLETPTNLLLQNRDLDFPFCLSWANETWSRRWDGRNHHVLVRQTHPPTKASWKTHYDYLFKAWSDPRAIKIGGKPVFLIYRPQRIEKIADMLGYWRELAERDGLPGLYFIFQKQHELPDTRCLESFDGIYQFQPFEAINSPGYAKDWLRRSPLFKVMRSLPESWQDRLRSLRAAVVNTPTFHDFDATWRQGAAIRPQANLATFPGAFADWDNTARYKKRAVIFRESTPAGFGRHFRTLVDSMPRRNLPESFIFFNAWNEWSEGACLEPDERHGLAYLDEVKEALLED
jgi:lipopolysaccharide biosynthesis protein